MTRDLDYLKLLGHEFPDAASCAAEIINLSAILGLPKGNEYFFSDIHGEYRSFIHLLRSASGVVRARIREVFGNYMSEADQLALANLIYYPTETLARMHREKTVTDEWYRITIHQLVIVCRMAGSKFTRSKVRKEISQTFAYAIDELLHIDETEPNKKLYYQEIIGAVIATEAAEDFIVALCDLVHSLLIDSLHIIGDLFDRGPRADYVVDELMKFHDVDLQWGNHDASWMGAACGNGACIATVLRIATSYNSFDVLEDGYGINLRPLSMFAADVYGDDPCTCFKPHLLDKNEYDSVDPELAAKMTKAITIIELKLEGQLIKRHPEYNQDDRLMLHRIDYEKGTIDYFGTTYPLKDTNFPTVDPADPYALSLQEAALMETLTYSFLHSNRLQRHIRYIYSHGSMYKICNGNLLFHGCIPMDEDGNFIAWKTADGAFSGKALMDYLEGRIIDAYFLDPDEAPERKQDAVDLLWYLWSGPISPLFGKDKMATFEHIFIEEPSLSVEHYNAYYRFSHEPETCDRIFAEFGIYPARGHIINGHVPVKVAKGEKPVKANGKLYVIDGGLSKAYHKKTGIAGYTLMFGSRSIALAEHREFVEGGENSPELQVTETMPHRLLVRDTDQGKVIERNIEDLKELLDCYRQGLIKEEAKRRG